MKTATSNVTSIDFKPRQLKKPGQINHTCVRYLTRRSLRGLSDNSQKAYLIDLEQFTGYLADRDIHHIMRVTAALLDDFVDTLLRGEGLHPRTVARKVQTVKGLFKYCVSLELLTSAENPAKNMGQDLRFVPRFIDAPSESAILRMIDSIETDTAVGTRDKAMFYLMYSTALRVGGICCLNKYYADQPPTYCVLPSGVVTYKAKGGMALDTLTDEKGLALLKDYLEVRYQLLQHDSHEPALFITRLGTRMTRHGIQYAIKRYGKAVGMPNIHSHLLRHRRIRNIMADGGAQPAHYISGHKNMSTTMDTYAIEERAKMREVVRTTAPVGGIKKEAGA